MADLLTQLKSYGRFRVLLVGDFMLDQSVFGAAERLSPDAPVPVLQATRTEQRPGGAANVATCLRALDGDVVCCGVIGDDAEGRLLREALGEDGCDVSGLIIDPTRPTTIKRSLIGLAQHRHPQKMFRMDIESRAPLDDEQRDRLIACAAAVIDDVDVVCLEDYNKGVACPDVCRRLVDLCRAHRKPLLVDPAAIEDFRKYRGATAVTPNRSEAELATGIAAPDDPAELPRLGLAKRLLDELELDAVVLTLDRHGALLERRDQVPLHLPTTARSVYDVSGAGDMVLAALAGATANRIDWPDAVRFANAAAGLEVEVFGVQPIPFARVHREVMAQTRPMRGKVRTLDELLVELAVHRAVGDRIVLTNGCFDVIHAGHVAYLREAKRQGDVLVVGVNADEQVRVLKGDGRPVYPIVQRLEILAEFGCVDYLVVFAEPTAHELLRAVHPHVYCKGGDYRPHEVREYDLVTELDIDLRLLAHRPGLGSTQVIERLSQLPSE